MAEKHGFVYFYSNKFCTTEYQPACARLNEIRANSWEDYFFNLSKCDGMLEESELERLEFLLMELIKLSKEKL